jgi:hypothetical protein
MGDFAEVLRILGLFPRGLSIRLIAEALNWVGGTARHRHDTRRVNRALIELAVQKLVVQEGKKWVLTRK